MDCNPNNHTENKENHSPSPTKSLYPKLPLPPASPRRPQQHGNTNSPLLSYDQAKRPGQTPNTSRKRRAMTTLINSPPRPSYADKVKGIFREPAPKKLHRWDGFGRRTPSAELFNASRSKKEVTVWSPLSSSSEKEACWNRPQGGVALDSTSGDDAGSSVEPMAVESHAEEPIKEQVDPENSPANPLRDLEEACELPPAFVPASHRCPNIPQIQEPLPVYDESSDSWTGDDEFLPRSSRRQKRFERKLADSPQRPSSTLTGLLRPEAPTYTSLQATASYPWPSPFAKPSRFRAAPTAVSYRPYAELPKPPVSGRYDPGASDADDEESTSS